VQMKTPVVYVAYLHYCNSANYDAILKTGTTDIRLQSQINSQHRRMAGHCECLLFQ